VRTACSADSIPLCKVGASVPNSRSQRTTPFLMEGKRQNWYGKTRGNVRICLFFAQNRSARHGKQARGHSGVD